MMRELPCQMMKELPCQMMKELPCQMMRELPCQMMRELISLLDDSYDNEMLVVESILHHWIDIADAGTLGIAVDHLVGEFDPCG
jgi:hypothetical protein